MVKIPNKISSKTDIKFFSFKKNKRHFFNIFWSNANQLALSLQMLLLSVMLVRYGGAELYGQFTYLYSLFVLVGVTSITGVRETVLKAASLNKPYTYNLATKYSFRMSLIGTFIIAVIGLYYLYLHNYTYAFSLLILAPFFSLFSSLQTWKSFYKGKGSFLNIFLLDNVKIILQILTILLILFFNQKVTYILLSYILIESSFNFFLHLKIKREIDSNLAEKGWKKQSYTFTYMDLSSEIFDKADILIMGIFYPPIIIGLYGIVMKVIKAFHSIMRSTINGVLPVFYTKDIPFKYYFFVAFLLAIGSYLVVLFLKPVLLLIYGEEIKEIYLYIQIYAFSLPFSFLNTISNYSLIKYKLNRQIVVNKSVSIAVVLLLYLILIPTYGILGGIASSTAYFFIQFILNYYSLKKASY